MFLKFLHVLLSGLLMVSSGGLLVQKHYCSGELKNAAFFVKPESCHAAQNTCPHHPAGEKEKDCCQNEVEFLKGVDLMQLADLALQVPVYNPLVVPVFVGSFQMEAKNHQPSFFLYKPPPPPLLMPARLQQFRC